ncbi:hypothetical protein MIND_00716500 [Mycena indigotica]|uniref:CcmS related domain-containing protein n=1 Tax=Mycena indigotica TaxID=2126181 RepID=A0A8H6SMS7_9AGAR|nr:uncharacterized protein MIND_00716500 [Mycena indigotica]KAF7301511.1 hypothetical protein MIND_00716500 [Mycena indigotica]
MGKKTGKQKANGAPAPVEEPQRHEPPRPEPPRQEPPMSKPTVLEQVKEVSEPDEEDEYYDYSAEEEAEAAAAGYGLADMMSNTEEESGWGNAGHAAGNDAWGYGTGKPAATPAADPWGKPTGGDGWGKTPAPSATNAAAGGWNTTTTIPTPAQMAAQQAAAAAMAAAAASANKGKKSDKKAAPAWQSWGAEATGSDWNGGGSGWGQQQQKLKKQDKGGKQAWESWGKESQTKGDPWGTVHSGAATSNAGGWGNTSAAGWGNAHGSAGGWGNTNAGAAGGWGNNNGGAWGETAATQYTDWGDDKGSAGAWGQQGWGHEEAKRQPKASEGKKGGKKGQQQQQPPQSQYYQQPQGKKGQKSKQKQDKHADPWGGGGGWDDGGWGTSAAADWGVPEEEMYSDESDSEDDRRVHFTPITANVWGGSQPESTYHMPSRTLAHAQQGTTGATPLFAGPPRDNIGEGLDIHFIDSKGAALVAAQQALFGYTVRRAKDRIHWMFPPNKDERVASLLIWISQMSDQIAAYGLHRFLQSRERGALIANADYRPPNHPDEPAFDWLTFDQLQPSRDKILQESVALYDPAATTLVFVFLPSKSGNSLAMWRRKIPIRSSLRTSRIGEISLALAGLRKEKDYYVLVDELPNKKAGDSKATKAKSSAVPAKSALKYDYGKGYYPYEPYEKKQKKKKKWWNIFG